MVFFTLMRYIGRYFEDILAACALEKQIASSPCNEMLVGLPNIRQLVESFERTQPTRLHRFSVIPVKCPQFIWLNHIIRPIGRGLCQARLVSGTEWLLHSTFFCVIEVSLEFGAKGDELRHGNPFSIYQTAVIDDWDGYGWKIRYGLVESRVRTTSLQIFIETGML